MMKNRLLFLFVFLLSFVFLTSYISAHGETAEEAKDTIYMIKMKTEIPSTDFEIILIKHGFKLIKHFNQIDVSVVSNNNPSEVEAFKLEQKDNIVYLEIDYPVSIIKTPDDKLFQDQISLKRLGMETAWNFTVGSYDVVVAVSDTGVATNHEDLLNQTWTNFKEIPNNNKDDDENGFIDDVSGWNFISNNGQPIDDNGHGTHVAGIIGAEGNNNYGVSGVNWNVLVMPLKFLDANGSGSTSQGISTILYAADNGAKILNASWGSTSNSSALKDALDYAYSKGMITVAAAGNNSANSDKQPIYPAGTDSDGVIAIASSSADGELSSFSNFGATSVHLAAPGSNILSTYLDNTFRRMSGTSMATPMASGVAALLLSYDKDLSALQLRNGLINSVTLRPSYDGLLRTGGDLNPSVTLAQINDQFKIWPHQINIKNGKSFQFSAYKAQGQVTWRVNAKDKKLATIDSTGRLSAAQNRSGVLTVTAIDEQGNETVTGNITIINANGGGGCTKKAYAGTLGKDNEPNIPDLLGYVLLAGFFVAYKKMRRRFSQV